AQAKAGATFESFLARRGAQHEALPATDRAKDTAPEKLPPYAGSQVCRACHADLYERWSQTGMARMLRAYRPEDVLGDFTRANESYEGDGVRWENGRVEVVPGKARSLFARAILEIGRESGMG